MEHTGTTLSHFAEALVTNGWLDAGAFRLAWRSFETRAEGATHPRELLAFLVEQEFLGEEATRQLLEESFETWEAAAALLSAATHNVEEALAAGQLPDPLAVLQRLEGFADPSLAAWFTEEGLRNWAHLRTGTETESQHEAGLAPPMATTKPLEKPQELEEAAVPDPFASLEDDATDSAASPSDAQMEPAPADDFVATNAESLLELPDSAPAPPDTVSPTGDEDEEELGATVVAAAERSRSASSSTPGTTGSPSTPAPPPPRRGASSSQAGIPTKMGFDNLVALDGVKGQSHERLGRYAVLGQIGKGGMGEVIEARDFDLNRTIALKLLLAGAGARSQQVEKFLIEAQVTGQLEHPNIPPVHELGRTPDGRVYFAMKHVHGQSLQAILKELRLRADPNKQGKDPSIPDYSLTDLLEIFLKICDGVAFAHSKGVVHRDLKPENVMVGEYGEVLVMDWGLAKVRGLKEDWSASAVKVDFEQGSVGSQVRGHSQAEAVKTMDGTILGTPAFMPPEQARGEINKIDHRSDIYSLGAMLYQILTLQVPFTGKSPYETLVKVINGELIPPTKRCPERKIPQELEALVLKAMALEPRKRYQSVSALQSDVRAFIEGHALSAVSYSPTALAWKWVKRNKGRVLGTAAAILVALVSVGVVLGLQWQREAQELAEREQEIEERIDAAQNELDTAEQQRERADAAFAQAEQLIAAAEGEPDFARADDKYDNALEHYDAAVSGFEQVRVLDETNPQAIRGASLAASRREALEAMLAERREEIRRAEQQAVLQREAREEGETLRQSALEVLERADARFERAQLKLYTEGLSPTGEPEEQPDFALYDEAAELIAQARARDSQSEAIQQTATRIATRRSEARTQWRHELELARRGQLSEQHHERGLAAFEAGERALAALQDEGRESAEEEHAEAFGHFTQALIELDRALEGFTQLEAALAETGAPSEEMINAVRERRRAAHADKVHTLLALGQLALANREFTIVQAWLNQTEALIEGSEELAEAVEALREELAQEMASAEQFLAALERARQAAAAERYAAALEQYTLAQTIADTAELRGEIRGVRFSFQLQQGDGYRQERNWNFALEAYEEARQYASTPGQHEDVERRITALREEAARVLLDEAREKLDDPDPTATERARELLDVLLELAPKTRQAAQAQLLRDELTARDVTPEGYVYVSGGEVALGSAVSSKRNPPRRLTIASFYMARHEVTVEAYARFVEAEGYERREYWSEQGWRWLTGLPAEERKPLDWESQQTSPSHPVVGVSAHEAKAYAAWWSETAEPLAGQRPAFRLPSEAEWELVARHTPNERLASGHRYPWGNDWSAGGFATGEARGRLRPVGSQTEDESAFRVRDLAGNASEWVRMIPHEQHEELQEALAESGEYGTRGGSNLMPGWQQQRFASVTKRGFVDGPETREPDLGFRLVRELPRE